MGEIENIPVVDNSADVVISNCVINLSPDKKRVFREAFRVLKSGGRLMVSDIVLLKELPGHIKSSTAAYIGCISGAIMKDEYVDTMKEVGFREVRVMDETVFPIKWMGNDPTSGVAINKTSMPKENLKEIGNSVVSIKVEGKKIK